jgi:hypothetical protein
MEYVYGDYYGQPRHDARNINSGDTRTKRKRKRKIRVSNRKRKSTGGDK